MMQKKIVQFVCQRLDGMCVWEFTWFQPNVRRILPSELEAMQKLAALMDWELVGSPGQSLPRVERGCPLDI